MTIKELFSNFINPFGKKLTTDDNYIDAIHHSINQLGIHFDASRIRLKDNNVKLIIDTNILKNNPDLLEKLKIQFPTLKFLIVQDSINDKSKTSKSYPHAPKSTIRPASIKKIIIVASGKGGVGKSAVSLNLARCFQEKGFKTALIDCDIHGPSTPIMTGGYKKAHYQNNKIQPVIQDGLKIMSIGYMIDPQKPVIWRGPMVSGAIGQIFQQTDWGDIDVAIVDMPPGTGDAQLTICQNLSPDGVIIVSQPQIVSVIDAERCASMFETMKLPIWGVIENMCGFVAPDTGKTYYIFGQGGAREFANSKNYNFLGTLPIVPMIAYCADQGINPFTIDDCQPFMNPLMDMTDYIINENLNLCHIQNVQQ